MYNCFKPQTSIHIYNAKCCVLALTFDGTVPTGVKMVFQYDQKNNTHII